MSAVNSGASQQAVVEAALILLERMGLSPADLTAISQSRREVPTFAEYVPVVSAAVRAWLYRRSPFLRFVRGSWPAGWAGGP